MDEKRSSDTDQPGQGGSGGSQGSDWNKESGRGTGDTGTE